MPPSTIQAINRLPDQEKRAIYKGILPPELLERFNLSPDLYDDHGRNLFIVKGENGTSSAEAALFHQHGFQDPVWYGHIQDTLNGQLHILLYVLNDPDSARFDVDRLPDGSSTKFGILKRNYEAEVAAMEAGLNPGQVRRGLGLLNPAIRSFEEFVHHLGHPLHFAEPLYYHNAIIFERYGFAYQEGRKLMQRIQAGFSPRGDLLPLLDNSTPFRRPEAAQSIRLRSWAIHDGILGEPFTNVTMYKRVGKDAEIDTCPDCPW
jgi:hypothetical protein